MRRTWISLVVALALPACGTTVQQTGSQAGGAGAVGQSSLGDGLSAGTGSGLGDGSPSAGTAAGAGTGQVGAAGAGPAGVGTAPGGSAPAGGAGAAGPATGPAAGAAGAKVTASGPTPGITSTTVFLGDTFSNDAAAANAALGAAATNTGDQRDYDDAVMAEVNARGGVLGRSLKGVYHEVRVSSGETADQQRQAACDTWFQDNSTFVIYTGHEIGYSCSAKAGAVAYGGGGASGPTYARHPHLVAPDDIRLERLSGVTVDGLVKQRWHVPEPAWPSGKSGVITWEDPLYEYGYRRGLEPALKRHGLVADEVRYVRPPQSANGLSDSSAAIGNAVLAFQTRGIDHVLIQDGPAGLFSGGGLTLFFLQSAESQGYRPRYGFNANNFPGDATYPPAQQSGMLAVDSHDYTPERDAGTRTNASRVRCFDIMRKAGLDVSSDQTAGQAALACDYVWFVEQTLRRAGSPTRAAFLRAVDATGTGFSSAFTYGTRLAPGVRDGVALFRTSRFDDDCACMRYTSAPFAP